MPIPLKLYMFLSQGLRMCILSEMSEREGQYGFMQGFESRAVSARVTKHFVTIFSKTCNNSKNSLPILCAG